MSLKIQILNLNCKNGFGASKFHVRSGMKLKASKSHVR